MSTNTEVGLVDQSRSFLQAARRGDGEDIVARLAALDESTIDGLTQDAALAFWINVYNATVQYRLRADPDQFDRRSFFGRALIEIAGQPLSLDDIEHGIIRRSQWKYGLGYIRKPFARGFEKRHRLDELDERIHFALNCGAASCPAVFGYEASRVDEQLDEAARAYLEETAEYDPSANQAVVPRLCLWYRGDFGGKRGIQQLLRRYEVVPADATPSLSYADYDWSLDLDVFRDERP